jgi:hypothetical protein
MTNCPDMAMLQRTSQAPSAPGPQARRVRKRSIAAPVMMQADGTPPHCRSGVRKFHTFDAALTVSMTFMSAVLEPRLSGIADAGAFIRPDCGDEARDERRREFHELVDQATLRGMCVIDREALDQDTSVAGARE